jgi:hypothetical protein
MDEQIEKTFSTPDGCQLIVENVRGEIAVEGWDQPSTRVIATKRKGQVDIEITQEGRKVIARTKHERNVFPWLDWLTKGSAPVVDYAVRVPLNSDIELRNVNGTIAAKHVRGNAHVGNVDGAVHLRAVKGQVQAETVNGSLDADALEGSAKLKTVNGQMKVAATVLESLNADTVNGDIDVAAAFVPEGTYVFHTVNGGCRLTIQPDLRAQVTAHGLNLSVDCQVPRENIEHKFGEWKGSIGTGDGPMATIRFDTVNGQLRIEGTEGIAEAPAADFVAKATPSETVSAAPPEEPPSSQPTQPEDTSSEAAVADSPPERKSQAEILQMIERGEISVEEALKLLREE